jgi:hypothetical protein
MRLTDELKRRLLNGEQIITDGKVVTNPVFKITHIHNNVAQVQISFCDPKTKEDLFVIPEEYSLSAGDTLTV